MGVVEVVILLAWEAPLQWAQLKEQERVRRMKQLRKVNRLGNEIVKGWEVVGHLPPYPCCLLLLFSSSAVADTRTRAGMP